MLQVVNMLFIAKMKFVYHYHLEIVVMLMLPFVALEVEHSASIRRAVPAFAVLALAITVFCPSSAEKKMTSRIRT